MVEDAGVAAGWESISVVYGEYTVGATAPVGGPMTNGSVPANGSSWYSLLGMLALGGSVVDGFWPECIRAYPDGYIGEDRAVVPVASG